MENTLMELPPLIPREVLFGNPEKTGPQISPDGTTLAYLAPSDGVLNVWVRTVGRTNDRAVTRDTLRGIRSFFWQGDSAHLLYLQDTGGDENFHLYQTEIAAEQTEDLTPFPGVRAFPLAMNPNIPGRMLVSLNQRDPRVFDVYDLDLATRELDAGARKTPAMSQASPPITLWKSAPPRCSSPTAPPKSGCRTAKAAGASF